VPKPVEFGGGSISVVSDEEAEECDYLVCVTADTPSSFPDNLVGFCCECRVPVIYRWHAPRKPKRICMRCMVEMTEKERDA
jgi:hypothetical protein